jgi:hypothetical protein
VTATRKRPTEQERLAVVHATLDQALSLPDLVGLDVTEALCEVDERFAKFSEGDIARNVKRAREGRWGASRLASELAIACGALDVQRRDGETKGAAVERVQDMFKKAVKRAESKIAR